MNYVSGVACKNLLTQRKPVVQSIDHIIPGLLYAYSDDDDWYLGVANYILVESHDVSIKFLQTNGPAAHFFRPSIEDTCWIPMHDIILKVNPPSYGSTG